MHRIESLSIGDKLLILGLLGLLAVSVPLYLQLSQSEELIVAAKGELQGVDPARQLLKLVQLTQQHRGLSAALLGGKSEVQAQRDAKRAEVDEALNKLDAQMRSGSMPTDLVSAWKDGTEGWHTLETAVDAKSLKAADSSGRHSAVIRSYLKVLDLMLDQSGLILDPSADTYYLVVATLTKLPVLTESLGQTRARGAGFLAEGAITPESRAMMAGLTQQARDYDDAMSATYGKAFSANDDLRRSLEEPLRVVQEPAAAALKLANDEVIIPETLKYPAPDYVRTFTAAIDSVFVLEDAALRELESRLDQRVTDLRRTQYVQFGLLAALLVAIALVGRAISRNITRSLNHAVALANRIAQGDLTGEEQVRGRDEVAQLLAALAEMRISLRHVVGEVRNNAESVATASREIAEGNSDLSGRTEQQAASLEQTASSLDEITSTVSNNADNAREANRMAQQARELAENGGQAVSHVETTMQGIQDSSRRIGDIISVIDSIAFQTNILALNAAVEAARAGENGRGFAVVASEVRGLAQRSAAAAREIKTLITESIDQVGAGSAAVSSTGHTMRELVDAIRRVADAVAHITQASAEQSAGLGQIATAVTHMDQMVQQNASLVEQSAAAAESLNEQAARLSRLVQGFRLESTQSP